MKYYKIKDVFVAEVFSISRNDNLIDLLFYPDLLILVKENDKYYDCFSGKEFLKNDGNHFWDNTFYIRGVNEIIYLGFLTNKELISGYVSEDRLRYLSTKVNDISCTKKRSLK